MKVTLTKIILTFEDNMNNVLNEKYGLSPNDIKNKSLSIEKLRVPFRFHRIKRTKKMHDRLDRYNKNKNKKQKTAKKCQCWKKKVLILAKSIRKNQVSGKFYKQSVQNIAYFNKKQTFVIKTKQK